MMFLLKSRFQFQDSDFRVLTDDQASSSQWPTRANMFEGFRWLAQDARPGDSLVFHYSGELDVIKYCTLCLTRQSYECWSGSPDPTCLKGSGGWHKMQGLATHWSSTTQVSLM